MSRALFRIQQLFVTFAYANRLTLSYMATALNTWSFLQRSKPRRAKLNSHSANRVTQNESQMARGRATQNSPAWDRYREEFGEIPGWFLEPSQALWDSLLSFQDRTKTTGRFLEIGVWKGKSATCSTLHAGADDVCVFVDRVILREFRRTIQSIRNSRNIFLRGRSSDPSIVERLMPMARTFRWIHIDGEHTGAAVKHDLSLSRHLLRHDGIIVVDDFFSSAYPQITFEVIAFLRKNPKFKAFICGHNKAYLCRRASYQKYLHYVKNELYRDMKSRGVDQVTIWKTDLADDLNCFGITDRVQQFDYRGPDHRPLKIEC